MAVLRASRSVLFTGGVLMSFMLILSVNAASHDPSSSSPSSDFSLSSLSSIGGPATLIVEQDTRDRMFGKWSLIAQGGTARESTLQRETADNLAPGNYTLLVDPPDGATAVLRLYRGEELIKSVDRQQMSFPLVEGDALRMVIHHQFTRVGTVIVKTDPPGVPFMLWGPNEQRLEGSTPQSYMNMPEGQYKVQFEALPGCVRPAPTALFLEKDKRISFSLNIACDEADRMRQEQETSPEKRLVSVTMNGESVTFEDVPQEAWFAPYIFETVRRGILSGYRDDRGRPTGRFGPGNNVTVAELAKICHGILGLHAEDMTGMPENPHARGQWFSPFIASAEQRGWTIFADATVDPHRDATRGEVLVTLLQALDAPLQWQKGTAFKDVTTRTPFAASIETAAAVGLISGQQDDMGEDTGLFGPLDPIKRAEMAKILDLAIELKLRTSSSARGS